MEANLLPANAEPRQLTADEMDLVSGGKCIIMPWVRIAICAWGDWEADFIGGGTAYGQGDSDVSGHDIDSPIPR